MTDSERLENDDDAAESEIYDGDDEVIEVEDGFVRKPAPDYSGVDSEIDFDDEEYPEELLSEQAAGNAEGGEDAHLDDPEEVADDETY